jgi:hypothetical protein
MPITKIKRSNLSTDAITSEKISQSLFAELTSNSNSAITLLNSAAATVNAIPTINTVTYANSSYYPIDDTAANTGGGYVIISGSNFTSCTQVIIDTTSATSISYVNSTTLHVQVPAKSAATYTLYVVNSDGSTAIKPLGITYSANPIWVTSSVLANAQANQAFTGSFNATGATSYNVATGSSLPTGLTLVTANGYYYGNISIGTETTYNFDITASDAENQDSTRSFSLTVTVGAPPGQVAYTTAGSYSWTVPAGVTSVCVVCVGGGGGGGYTGDGAGGGGGGGLGYKNNISVTPGASIPLVVGAAGASAGSGGTSYFSSPSIVQGIGGSAGTSTGNGAGGAGGGYVGDGGGNGGAGGQGYGGDGVDANAEGGGGGGAGGYSGSGGQGASYHAGLPGGAAGSGGGGGGGGGSDGGGGGGGGVGLLGQGTSGLAGGKNSPSYSNGGSGGANGTATGSVTIGDGFNGGAYGGGGGGVDSGSVGGLGGVGAVRIIWGPGRSFPTTQTGDL